MPRPILSMWAFGERYADGERHPRANSAREPSNPCFDGLSSKHSDAGSICRPTLLYLKMRNRDGGILSAMQKHPGRERGAWSL